MKKHPSELVSITCILVKNHIGRLQVLPLLHDIKVIIQVSPRRFAAPGPASPDAAPSRTQSSQTPSDTSGTPSPAVIS